MSGIINVPNTLTLIRILLAPVIVYMILSGEAWLALVLMMIAGVTDMLDGAIAKYFNQRTIVGSYLDPLADKLMLISAFVALFIVDQVPLFLFLAIVFRDAVIVVGALAYEVVTHSLTMEPTLVSKATTCMQIVYVVMLLVHMVEPLSALWLDVAMWATFALTCISGIHYMLIWTSKAVSQEN